MKRLLIWTSALWFSASLFPPCLPVASAAERSSFAQYREKLKEPEKIGELYGSSEINPKALGTLLKKNQKNLEALLKDFEESRNFHRGEIEDEQNLNALIQYLQLSVLRVRLSVKEKKWADIEKQMKPWFQFAADFPYEEASLVGLRATSVVRSLLLDELEKISQDQSVIVAEKDLIRPWFLAVRAPWPIDRVIITEGKKVLKPAPMSVAEKIAKELQKNPYQTSEAVMAKTRGGGAKDLEFLKEVWREKDIDLMKTEVNRIGSLRLLLARKVYESKFKKAPASAEELVQSGLLDRVPMDYKSGKPMSL